MTYYGARELAASLRVVRKNTLQIAEEIPKRIRLQADPRLAIRRRVAGAHRAGIPLPETGPHADEHRATLAGIDFGALIARSREEEARLASKAQIVEALRANGEAWASWIESLPEPFLAERVEMPGEPPSSKSRFEMLLSSKEHEMHHRGQLMLIERLLGLVPHLTRERQARMQPRG